MRIFTILILTLLISSCAKNVEENTENNTNTKNQTEDVKALRHVVLFKFKETATKENIKTVEDAFAALPSKIEEIKDFEWGTNNSPEGLDKGFTHSFMVTFDSKKDREIYLPHPDHQAFVEVLKPYLDDVLVIDYWTE